LQWLGTDILRTHINQDFFVMNMKQRIDQSKANCIIISDVRFDNEAEFIKSLGGKIIKIERDVTDKSKNSGKTTEHSHHITEKGISPHLIDAIIQNNSSIEEFQNIVKFVVNKVLFNNSPSHIDFKNPHNVLLLSRMQNPPLCKLNKEDQIDLTIGEANHSNHFTTD